LKHLLRSILVIFILTYGVKLLHSQNIKVGSWRSHLPFHNAVSLTHNGEEVIAATEGGVLFYNPADQSVRTLSTVSGLANIGASAVQYDTIGKQLIIGYNNLNIDIYKNNSIVNFPAIKNSGITGEKRINDIYLKDKLGYVCGTFGIALIDFENLVINETYGLSDGSIEVEVYNIVENGQKIMAATEIGIFEANVNAPNLFDVKQWLHHDSLQNINKEKVNQVAYDGQTFFCLKNNIIYAWENEQWKSFYEAEAGQQIRHFAFDKKKLFTSELKGEKARIVEFTEPDITKIYTYYSFQRPGDMMFFNNNIWMADNWSGLHEIIDSANIKQHRPSAPTDGSIYALTTDAKNNVWVAAGAAPANFDSNIIYSNRGVYMFNNYGWSVTNRYSIDDSLFLDIVSIAVHPVTDVAYIGTYIYGLFALDGVNKMSHYDETNSSLQRSVGNEVSIVGMGFDQNNNLWLSNNKTEKPIKLLTNEGDWHAFKPNFSLPSSTFTEILVTELYNQVWVVVDRKGILVYDYGQDVTATGDDRYVFLDQNSGSGNLPNEQVYAMAEDKLGQIWVGTTEGIGIYFCPNSLFEPEGCDAYIPIVQNDAFAGPLLESDVVNCIKIDNADRKWIGTGNGVWLLSKDGNEVIHRFTTENSPLPANEIKDIAINQQSGEVFIGTSKGIVSYRGSASQGQNNYEAATIFPNPVEPGYEGDIIIQNLLDESNVKITDVSGNLVYETTSLGGQIVWNGADYTGRKVGSGVYMVFATNFDGSAGYEGKIMIIR